jgi:hypothetical protein
MLQRASAESQRGANAQPGGSSSKRGGKPGMVGIGPAAQSRRGTQRSNCRV